MSNSEVKKRLIPNGKTNIMETPLISPKADAGTVTWDEVPEWQRDNKYILRGYRPGKADLFETLTSLTFLHNETCNVYTHLIGALLLPLIATIWMRTFSGSQYFGVTGADYVAFGIYFWLAEACLVISTTYHLFGSYSHDVEQFWLRMDLLGIVIVTVGTFVSGIYYVYFCDPGLQKVHWAIIISSASATAAMMLVPKFRKFRTARTITQVALGASSLIPLLHGVYLWGLEYMMKYSGMSWYLVELTFYGSGVIMYAFRTPERLSPGTFDIFGASHQIFHVCILCAIYCHILALTQAFTACHTLDICSIQAAALRANQ